MEGHGRSLDFYLNDLLGFIESNETHVNAVDMVFLRFKDNYLFYSMRTMLTQGSGTRFGHEIHQIKSILAFARLKV